MAAGFHQAMRLRGLRQREGGVDQRLAAPGLQQRPERFGRRDRALRRTRLAQLGPYLLEDLEAEALRQIAEATGTTPSFHVTVLHIVGNGSPARTENFTPLRFTFTRLNSAATS